VGHHASLQDFLSAVVEDFVVLLKALVVIAVLFFGSRAFHAGSMHRHARKAAKAKTEKLEIQNNLLLEQVNATKKLVTLLEGTVERGSNVKVAGIEVSNWRSNLHTLHGAGGVVDATPIAPPVTEVRQIEGPTIKLAQDCPIPANDVLSGRKLIVGMSGSGKSNTVGTYSEELGKLEVPLLLADTENEYQPLCNPLWLPSGMKAGKTGAHVVLADNAYQFGRYILQEMKQVIFNLQSYEEMEEAALVMIGIIAGMRDWEEERENEQRIPSELILEEAVTWLPQNIKESPLYGTATLNALQGTFFNDMVRKGRKRGLGITVICQKVAEIDKRALQCDAKILHSQNEGPDLAVYEKMGISREETLSLQRGDAYLYSSHASKKLIHVRQRYSPHGGNTPGLEQLQRYQQRRNRVETEAETWRNPEISDGVRNHFEEPTEPFRNISDFRKPITNTPKREGREIPTELRNQVAQLYRDGTGRVKISEQLHLSDDQYWQLRDICNAVDREREAGGA
jgi:uncharacterized protein DUF87